MEVLTRQMGREDPCRPMPGPMHIGTTTCHRYNMQVWFHDTEQQTILCQYRDPLHVATTPSILATPIPLQGIHSRSGRACIAAQHVPTIQMCLTFSYIFVGNMHLIAQLGKSFHCGNQVCISFPAGGGGGGGGGGGLLWACLYPMLPGMS